MAVYMATPEQMRQSLEAVEVMKSAGINFIPVPVMNDEDRGVLLGLALGRLKKLENDAATEEAANAEKP